MPNPVYQDVISILNHESRTFKSSTKTGLHEEKIFQSGPWDNIEKEKFVQAVR